MNLQSSYILLMFYRFFSFMQILLQHQIKVLIYFILITTTEIFAFNTMDTLYVFPSAREVEPTITSVVTKADNYYKYSYTITSSVNSEQNIWRVLIENNANILPDSTPQNWRSGYVNKQINILPVWAFYTYFVENDIAPGEILTGCSFLSKGLPAILKYFVEGNADLLELDEEVPDELIVDATFVENSVQGFTLGPVAFPNPFIYTDFIDTLTTYTNTSYTLGWITDEQTRDKYNNYFNTAKTYLEQGDSSVARVELEKVLIDCNADSSTVLTSEAYALLYFNTEYLVNKLPKTQTNNGLPVKLEDGKK